MLNNFSNQCNNAAFFSLLNIFCYPGAGPVVAAVFIVVLLLVAVVVVVIIIVLVRLRLVMKVDRIYCLFSMNRSDDCNQENS